MNPQQTETAPSKPSRGTSGVERRATSGSAEILWLILLVAGSALVYLVIAGGFRFDFPQSPAPHHILIADAFLHGQTYLSAERVRAITAHGVVAAERNIAEFEQRTGNTVSPAERTEFIEKFVQFNVYHDWTSFKGKLYGYWAPLTAVAMMPFVALFGVGVSDLWISALFGAVNVGLFYWLLWRVDRAELSTLSRACRVALTLVFAFGTVHFYSACIGQVWFAAQVITLTAVLAALIVLCAPATRWWHVLLCGAFFGVAILGRNVVGMLIGFFLVLIWMRTSGPLGARLRQTAVRIALFAGPCAVAVALQGSYNYARFGNVLDTGLATQILTTGHPRFLPDFKQHGEFSPHFILRNLRYYFWNFDLKVVEGKLQFDRDGNSLFMVTPLLIYVFLLRRRWTGFTIALLCGVVPFMAVLMCYFATGWSQWGTRYLMEALPLLLLLAAAGMNGRLSHISYALSVLAIAVNLAATYRFCEDAFGPVQQLAGWGVLALFVIMAALARVGALWLRPASRPEG